MKSFILTGLVISGIILGLGLMCYGVILTTPSKRNALGIGFADDIHLDHNQLIVCTYLSELNSMECTSIEEFMTRTTEL